MEPTGQGGAGQLSTQYFVKTHELLHALEEGDTTPPGTPCMRNSCLKFPVKELSGQGKGSLWPKHSTIIRPTTLSWPDLEHPLSGMLGFLLRLFWVWIMLEDNQRALVG